MSKSGALAGVLSSVTAAAASPSAGPQCVDVLSQVVMRALVALELPPDSAPSPDAPIDLRELSLTVAAVDVVLSLGVVPLLGNGILSRFVPGGLPSGTRVDVDDPIVCHQLAASFLSGRRVVALLKADASALARLVVEVSVQDNAHMRGLGAGPGQDATGPRLSILLPALTRLLSLMARPHCDGRLFERFLPELTAAALFVAACPSVSVDPGPFDSPASLFLKAVAPPAPHPSPLALYNTLFASLPPSSQLGALLALAGDCGPLWFASAVSSRLTSALLLPGGVEALIVLSVCNVPEERFQAAADAVSALIRIPPTDVLSPEEYFGAVGPQLLELLSLGGEKGRKIACVSAGCVSALLASPSTAVHKHVVAPLLTPLACYTHPPPSAPGAVTVVAEGTLVACVEHLHKVLTVCVPTAEGMAALAPVVPALFDMFCLSMRALSHIAAACEEILLLYLRFATDAVGVLLSVALGRREGGVAFAVGPSAGVEMRVVTSGQGEGALKEKGATVGKEDEEEEEEGLGRARGCARLLQHASVKNTSVPGDVILALLERYGRGEGGVALLRLAVEVVEAVGPSALRNTQQALRCVLSMLSSATSDEGGKSEEEEEATNKEEVTLISLVLLSMPAEGVIPVNEEDDKLLRACVAPLLALGKHANPEISELATSLRVSILSRYSPAPSGGEGEEAVRAQLASALALVMDPALPVQAGGLTTLAALVKTKAPALLSRLDDLCTLVVSQLKNTDSYVYLAAVAALSALVDAFPEVCIPKLCVCVCDGGLPLRDRVKMGMSLSQAIRKCGATFPRHARRVVAALMTGIRESGRGGVGEGTSEYRASCVSCLMDVVSTLGASAVTVAPAVMDVCICVLQLEGKGQEGVPVRRAATCVIATLARACTGFGVFQALAPQLPALRAALQSIAECDSDALTRGHAEEAMALMRSSMAGMLDLDARPKALNVSFRPRE